MLGTHCVDNSPTPDAARRLVGSIPIHFRFFAFFILFTECRLTSGAPRDTFTETRIVQNQRKKLTESAWFWVYLFSTAGLIGLVILIQTMFLMD